MKFLKAKTMFLFIGIVALLTTFSVVVSVRISITMIEKKSQLVEARAAVAKSVPVAVKTMEIENVAKAAKYPVFFNGSTEKAFDYYSFEDKKSFIPFDILLQQLGITYMLYNPDDVFQTTIDGKKMDIVLHKGKILYNGEGFDLGTASIAAENHILVSPEILDLPVGFKINDTYGKDGVFLNYWLSSRNKDFRKTYMFILSSGVPKVAGLLDGSGMTFGVNGPGKLDVVIYCPDISSYLLKAGAKTWRLGNDNFKKPKLLNIPPEYEVSTGGKYLYWLDKDKKYVYVYDIGNNTTKKLRNYFTEIEDKKSAAFEDYKLAGFQTGKRYVRMDFQEKSGMGAYTVVERRGKIVAVGDSYYSPDKSRILFSDNSKGYFVIDSDGTDIIKLGEAKNAYWIDKDRIFLDSDGSMRIFSRGNRKYTTIEKVERYVGQIQAGEVFFQRDNMVYSSSGNSQKEMFELPWKCDYVAAKSSKGPFSAVSLSEDSILGIWADKRMLIGIPSLFFNKPVLSSAKTYFESNTAFSPDNKKIALLQKGDRFLEVNIASIAEMKLEKLMLDYPIDDTAGNSNMNVKWLDNSSMLVYNDRQGWILDLKNGSHIYKWVNKETDSTICDFEG